MATRPHFWSLDSPRDGTLQEMILVNQMGLSGSMLAPIQTTINNIICHMKTLAVRAIRRDFDFSFFGFDLRFRVFKVKTLALRRDLSMSKDMWDPMRANVGFAANMLTNLKKVGHMNIWVELS